MLRLRLRLQHKDIQYVYNKDESVRYYTKTSLKNNNHSSNVDKKSNLSRFSYNINDIVHGFKLISSQSIPDYSIKAHIFLHEKTKATYYYMETNDIHNVFCVGFKTPPYNSTGISHILEHMVLCGSKMYPIRDPFFNMMKRSLNTFMNAMTGSDYTFYPFSTMNKYDYYNLQKVYLDAVFFPLLKEIDFLQEGHRLEINNNHINSNNIIDKINIQGVVYNEMKGALSDPITLFNTKLQQILFPNTPYQYVSGGDPIDIPDLTYKELKDFHSKYYCPSNALFYSYGHLTPENTLSYLDKNILNRFNYHNNKNIQINCKINNKIINKSTNTSLKSKNMYTIYCSPSIPDEQDKDQIKNILNSRKKICIAFPLFDSTDIYECLIWKLISYLLTNGPSSPMYQSLIETKLGMNFIPGIDFDSSTKISSFSLGLQGIDENNFDKALETIEETLKDVVQAGFTQERIKACLHQIELQKRHIDSNPGLNILYDIIASWAHGGNTFDQLQISTFVNKIKKDLKQDPKFLQKRIQKYLLDNKKNNVILKMLPDENYIRNQENLIRKKLITKMENLIRENPNYIENEIILKNNKLNEFQNNKQNVDVLPTLTIKDIPINTLKTEILSETLNDMNNIQFIPEATNGIIYTRLLFNTENLPDHLKPFLPFFCIALTRLGTSTKDHKELSVRIESCSGGMDAKNITKNNLFDLMGPSKDGIMIHSTCLASEMHNTYSLIEEILNDVKYDNTRQVGILLNMITTNIINNGPNMSHKLGKIRCQSSFSLTGRNKEIYDGFTQINFLKSLRDYYGNHSNNNNELLFISETLKSIATYVFNQKNLNISIVGEEKLLNQIKESLLSTVFNTLSHNNNINNDILSLYNNNNLSNVKHLFQLDDLNKNYYFIMPVEVHSVIKSIPTVPFLHSDHVPLVVLSELCSTNFLHREIREKGGAYGCSMTQGHGMLTLSSYYDPNTQKTLDSFNNAMEWAKTGNYTKQDIDESLLSIFGSIDSPLAPSDKGKRFFLDGVTDEMMAKRRKQYLNITKEQLINVANKYLISDNNNNKHRYVIVGREKDSNMFKDKNWTIHKSY